MFAPFGDRYNKFTIVFSLLYNKKVAIVVTGKMMNKLPVSSHDISFGSYLTKKKHIGQFYW